MWYSKNSLFINASPLYLQLTCLCRTVSEDPLIGGDELTTNQERERSVLGSDRKLFFSPRTFGQGERGEFNWFVPVTILLVQTRGGGIKGLFFATSVENIISDFFFLPTLKK